MSKHGRLAWMMAGKRWLMQAAHACQGAYGEFHPGATHCAFLEADPHLPDQA